MRPRSPVSVTVLFSPSNCMYFRLYSHRRDHDDVLDEDEALVVASEQLEGKKTALFPNESHQPTPDPIVLPHERDRKLSYLAKQLAELETRTRSYRKSMGLPLPPTSEPWPETTRNDPSPLPPRAATRIFSPPTPTSDQHVRSREEKAQTRTYAVLRPGKAVLEPKKVPAQKQRRRNESVKMGKTVTSPAKEGGKPRAPSRRQAKPGHVQYPETTPRPEMKDGCCCLPRDRQKPRVERPVLEFRSEKKPSPKEKEEFPEQFMVPRVSPQRIQPAPQISPRRAPQEASTISAAIQTDPQTHSSEGSCTETQQLQAAISLLNGRLAMLEQQLRQRDEAIAALTAANLYLQQQQFVAQSGTSLQRPAVSSAAAAGGLQTALLQAEAAMREKDKLIERLAECKFAADKSPSKARSTEPSETQKMYELYKQRQKESVLGELLKWSVPDSTRRCKENITSKITESTCSPKGKSTVENPQDKTMMLKSSLRRVAAEKARLQEELEAGHEQRVSETRLRQLECDIEVKEHTIRAIRERILSIEVDAPEV